MMVGENHARALRLEALRRQIARTARFPADDEKAAFLGIDEIDRRFKSGLARGSLHEIAAADYRSGPAALGFMLALTLKLERSGGVWLWPLEKNASAFGTPFAPGLRFFGINPSRLLLVRCATGRDCLWAMEEGLRLGAVAAVIGMRIRTMDLTASRRLQLAAEQARTPVLLLRNYSDRAPSAAATRWRVSPAPSARDPSGFYKNARFRVALEYARGGKNGEWAMEWNHDALSLRLSSLLGNRGAGENRAA